MQNITQLENERVTHSQDVLRGDRQYISAATIRLLAQKKFKQGREEGLTYEDLIYDGPFKCVECEQRAQDTLHYHHKKGHLFTYRRTNPQQYFATPDDAEMAAIYRKKNTHSDRIGVRSSCTSPNRHSSSTRDRSPLANALEYSKVQTLYHGLIMLKVAPLEMHNIRLHLKLTDPKRYDVVHPHHEEENRAKVLRRRKGSIGTTYKVYPCGTVEISIECSKTPFPIETESDLIELFSFIGEVRNTLQDWLLDVNGYIVPSIKHWRLVHADINKDVKVPQRLHETIPPMDLRTADRVLRMYVKTLGNGSVLRLEEMRMFNEAFDNAVNSLRKGACSASPAAIFTHSINPAALVEKAEVERKIVMLTSELAQTRETVESLQVAMQDMKMKVGEKCSEQVVVSGIKQNAVDTIGTIAAARKNDGYMPFEIGQSTATISGSEGIKEELLEEQQQSIPASTDFQVISAEPNC